MKARSGNNFPIINISAAKFTDDDVKIFREEVSKAVTYGLFPVFDLARKDAPFDISKVGTSPDGERSAFSIVCKKSGWHGEEQYFDIREGEAFRLAFSRDVATGEFTHFSTNLSSQLFSVLMMSCPRTSKKLFEQLKGSDYEIIDSTPPAPEATKLTKREATVRSINSYLAGKADIAKAQEIFAGINYVIQVPLASSSKSLDEEELRRVIKDCTERSGGQYGSKAEFAKAIQNPLDPRRKAYVAEQEIIPQLMQARAFEGLPKRPVIIDVGSAEGLNLEQIREHVPSAITLGLEPSHHEAQAALKRTILTYKGFAESTPELEGKADLVTVFNINVSSDANAFYRSCAKMLAPNGRLIVGVNFNDDKITRSGKTVLQHLQENFENVEQIPNPDNFSQTLYVASKPRTLELATEAPVFREKMKTFVGEQQALRRSKPTQSDFDNQEYLKHFLKRVSEKDLSDRKTLDYEFPQMGYSDVEIAALQKRNEKSEQFQSLQTIFSSWSEEFASRDAASLAAGTVHLASNTDNQERYKKHQATWSFFSEKIIEYAATRISSDPDLKFKDLYQELAIFRLLLARHYGIGEPERVERYGLLRTAGSPYEIFSKSEEAWKGQSKAVVEAMDELARTGIKSFEVVAYDKDERQTPNPLAAKKMLVINPHLCSFKMRFYKLLKIIKEDYASEGGKISEKKVQEFLKKFGLDKKEKFADNVKWFTDILNKIETMKSDGNDESILKVFKYLHKILGCEPALPTAIPENQKQYLLTSMMWSLDSKLGLSGEASLQIKIPNLFSSIILSEEDSREFHYSDLDQKGLAKENWEMLDHYFQTIRKTTDGPTIKKESGKLMHLLGGFLPCHLGSAAVGDWMVKAIGKSKGYQVDFETPKGELGWDFKAALTPNIGKFQEWFDQMTKFTPALDRAPSGKALHASATGTKKTPPLEAKVVVNL